MQVADDGARAPTALVQVAGQSAAQSAQKSGQHTHTQVPTGLPLAQVELHAHTLQPVTCAAHFQMGHSPAVGHSPGIGDPWHNAFEERSYLEKNY